MKIKLTEELWKEGNMYVSYCPELDIASCGETIEQAKKNLQQTISITIAETKKMGTFDQFLQEAGFSESQNDVLYIRKELVGFTPIVVGV
jgi:predicted RNase H-like HicB family nuclease